MGAIPISRSTALATQHAIGSPSPAKEQHWLHLLSAGTLVAGGVLIATGNRRAGLAVAATGAALAVLEEREAIETLWKDLPGYLREAQTMLDKVEGYMNQAVVKGHKLQNILRR